MYLNTLNTEHSATLLDNIFTNTHPTPKSGIILADISDHFPIFANIQTPHNLRNKHSATSGHRKFTEENIAILSENLALICKYTIQTTSTRHTHYLLLNS